MSGNDWALGFGALAASLLLHGLLFFNTGSIAGNSEQVEPKRKVTRVSFRAVAAPQTPPQAQPETALTPPEPEVTEAPEPAPEPPPPKKAMQAQKARQPEPLAKAPPQQAVSPPVPTTEEAEKSPASAEVVAGSVQDPALIEQAKQEYLRRLMAHIEAYKEYPRAARRRRIEGDVRVVFSLLAGGEIGGLRTDGGHSLLDGAARLAVEQAAPMPTPPESLGLPWQVAFTMRFSLN